LMGRSMLGSDWSELSCIFRGSEHRPPCSRGPCATFKSLFYPLAVSHASIAMQCDASVLASVAMDNFHGSRLSLS
jgi:hypothetical protein